ncbi:hypothetical protein IFM89_012120 [Coptis chinensis]|uniref:Dirigent protein n=1 Tax=Coptis chinensis TaxID=261450 RepID=A0A835I3G8_9MAGN|nr:hypothetical protein IFM89_012120 [Coptis chinensis]
MKEKVSHLHFYFHDTNSGGKPSPKQIVGPKVPGFGTMMITDDPLIEGLELTSKLVGKAQGIYASAAQKESGLLMVLNYAFMEGKYNGSTSSNKGDVNCWRDWAFQVKFRGFSQHEQEASGHEQHTETRGTQGVQVDYGYVQQYDREQENSPTNQVLGKDGLGSGDEACVSRQNREVCVSRKTREIKFWGKHVWVPEMRLVSLGRLERSVTPGGDFEEVQDSRRTSRGSVTRQNREVCGSRQTREVNLPR